jgi:L-threonylcarbamoyladenylate synthase
VSGSSQLDPALADQIAGAAAVLRRGGVIAYPTETFYGLGALASDGAAVERLLLAKQRPEGKPLPLLGADLAQLEAV